MARKFTTPHERLNGTEVPRAARGLTLCFFFIGCALAGFSGHLRALFSRFRKADSDCLFSRWHFPAFPAFARTQRTALFAMHRVLYTLACSFTIFPVRPFFPRHLI